RSVQIDDRAMRTRPGAMKIHFPRAASFTQTRHHRRLRERTNVIESGLAIARPSFLVFVAVAVFVVVVVLKNLTERSMGIVFEEFAPAVNLAEQVIKAGNDQDSDDGADEHAAGSRGANGSVPDRPGAGGQDQRQETRDEGEGGHLDRPESQ